MNFNSVVIGSSDPARLVDFYSKVLGKTAPDMDSGTHKGFLVGTGFMVIGPHSEVSGKNPNPGRIMIGIECEDVQGEFARIRDLGAEVIAEPYRPEEEGMWLATLSDPDGNYFQLASPLPVPATA